ncbi:MAG: polymer-forming cytoskeletal protein [Dehalococcoidia bacterium]
MQFRRHDRDSRPPAPDESIGDEMSYETNYDEASRPAVGVEPAAMSFPVGQSVIDANSTFDGRYEAAQDLVIFGSLSGEVICRGLFRVEQNASAKAKIETRDAHIRGVLEGDIVCSGRLVVASTASISGTVKTAALVVEEGAQIKGTIETTTVSSAAPAAVADTGARSTKPASSRREAAETATGETAATPSWRRSREVPSFAIVSSDDRSALDRN